MPRPPNRSPQTLLVLAALVEQPAAWRHGYDLAKQTELKSGTLYPILMRLSEQGLLEEDWEAPETPGRPHRHIYRLTAAGVTAARALVKRAGRSTLRPAKTGAQ